MYWLTQVSRIRAFGHDAAANPIGEFNHMCYSAQIVADYRKYVKMFGAHMSIKEFAELYWEHGGRDLKAPLAMEAAFSDAQTDDERRIQALIAENNAVRATKLEQEVFEQRTRLAKAERILETKATKAAAESKRIASNKIDAAVRRLADLKRTTLKDADSRIYPGWYAPVMIVQDGHRVVVPMRYRCRLPGWTEEMEKEKPGTYNALRTLLTVRAVNFPSYQAHKPAKSFLAFHR
ncbi:hypothetical protein [Paraburkholderia fungorum]|uniref:hypothetical protein n=1 Tax=Paraburkholderia fungorum TaxID=134537 RepID=UPI0020968E8C|nr:hypothetical protein [Paraburkholderia fungorum]USX11051.1 hypothetical protein NHH62_40815 [Paraburkholderia fungorum]